MRHVRFVRLAIKIVMQNDGDLVDVILLYITLTCLLHYVPHSFLVCTRGC